MERSCWTSMLMIRFYLCPDKMSGQHATWSDMFKNWPDTRGWENKHENFNLIHLFFFFTATHNSKVYGVCEYYTYQMTVLIMQIICTCLELCVKYDWRATALKLSPDHNAVSIGCFFGFSCNKCMYTGRDTNSQATPGLLNVCVTGCEEFAALEVAMSLL